jgi:hypothetical protein
MPVIVDSITYSAQLPLGSMGWSTGHYQAADGTIFSRQDSHVLHKWNATTLRWTPSFRTDNTTPMVDSPGLLGDNINLNANGGCYEAVFSKSSPAIGYCIVDYRLWKSVDTGATWTFVKNLRTVAATKTSITGNLTISTPNVTNVTDVTGLWVGQGISGANIPASTTISSITGAGPFTVVMSANATASATAQSCSVTYVNDFDANTDWHKHSQYKMAIHPTNPAILLVGSRTVGLQRSTDSGATFTRVGATALPTKTPNTNNGGITNIQWSRDVSRPARVLAYCVQSNWAFSDDDGVTWTAIASGPTGCCFMGNQRSTGELWATDWDLGGSTKKTWKLSAAATPVWTDTSATYAAMIAAAPSPFGFIINPSNDNHIIYADLYCKLAESTNGGTSFGAVRGSSLSATDCPAVAAVSDGQLVIGRLSFDVLNNNKLLLSFGLGFASYTYTGSSIYTAGTTNDFVSMTAGIEQLISKQVLVTPTDKGIYNCWDQHTGLFFDASDRANVNHTKYITTVYGKQTGTVGGIYDAGTSHWMPSNPNIVSLCHTRLGTGPAIDAGLLNLTTKAFTPLATYPTPAVGTKLIMEFLPLSATKFVTVPTGAGLWISRNTGAAWEEIALPGMSANQKTGWSTPYQKTAVRLAASQITPDTFFVYVPPEFNGGFSAIVTPAHVYKVTLGVNSAADVITTVYTSPAVVPVTYLDNASNYFRLKLSHLSDTELLYCGGGATSNMYHSLDGAATWTPYTIVSDVAGIDFGKPAPGKTNPSIIFSAIAESKIGVYQTDDRFATIYRRSYHPANNIDRLNTVGASKTIYGDWWAGFGGSGMAYGRNNSTSTFRMSVQQ